MSKLLSRSKAQIAVLKCQLIAAYKNYTSSAPLTDSMNYDLLIDTNNDILRAQVKFCNRYHGKNNLELRLDNKSSNRAFYTKENIDILLVYIPKLDIVLAYGPEDFHKKSRIQINLNNPDSSKYYKKYIW